jgi:starch phosphorylase
MPTLRRYTVVPRLPAAIEKLRDIAGNLWWSWSAEARELFLRIDAELWETVRGNPIELLASVEQKRLDEIAGDDAFLGRLESAHATLQRYLSREGWFKKTFPETAGARIAYFSMEYGLHECLPIYSGGLGVLAGDHLKTASDLGLPLVGIGLAYAEGYFRQALNRDGLQQERYPINDWDRMPVAPVFGTDGSASSTRSSGRPRSDGFRSFSSTRTSPRTAPRTAPSRARSTAETPSSASGRRSCSASAACTPSRRWGSRRRCAT